MYDSNITIIICYSNVFNAYCFFNPRSVLQKTSYDCRLIVVLVCSKKRNRKREELPQKMSVKKFLVEEEEID